MNIFCGVCKANPVFLREFAHSFRANRLIETLRDEAFRLIFTCRFAATGPFRP
ncbi:hypothetical protein ALO50_100979 [Pseudomonas syringae pv. cerasicola]|uniref:Uncharacterized protein n=3 Tax=Pseudomonas syringae group TaxID=136849 RepID=A0A0P9VDK2_9PSED|nr:hypothetical protein ALO50_100979 [Pseudomonas syringae pv. cerasicola]KPX82192.1 hypothetical protein ALO64_100102 [Pseudomonas meliae]RMS79892.1 hypothetical protein ALP61_100111 [Pseudomonas savastanoi]RMS82945.1 hypothetical protein ALP60_100936 [Pseudomonas savastanoi]RMT50165.1 hypothetical protein ALP47_100947 [Pseudomonas savastanoi]